MAATSKTTTPATRVSEPTGPIARLTQRYTGVLWICLIGTLAVLIRMASVPLGTKADDLGSGTNFVLSLLGLVLVTSCIAMTYIWVSTVPERTKKEHFAGDGAGKVLALFPLVVTLSMSPWVLSGFLTDPETSVPMSIFLWLLLVYAALLLGFLALPAVVLPIWLFFTGVWQVLRGNRDGWTRIFAALLLGGIETLIFSLAKGTTSAPGRTRINGYDADQAGNYFWLMWAAAMFLALLYFGIRIRARRVQRKKAAGSPT